MKNITYGQIWHWKRRNVFESDQVEVQGVVLEEEYDKEREIRVTTVRIETENGAKTMGKPVGTYLTIEAPNLSSPDEGIHREVSEELAKYLIEVMEKIIPESEHDKEVLVIGLGNRQATPDALYLMWQIILTLPDIL